MNYRKERYAVKILRNKRNFFEKLPKNSLVFAVLFIVTFLTVGFSAFSQKFIMNDIVATITPDENVMVTTFGHYSSTNGGTSSDNGYGVSAVASTLSLPNSDSTVTYTVTVKNFGNVEMGISNIVLPKDLEGILDISVSNYTIGTKLRDNGDSCENSSNGCTLSIQRTFYITVKYANGAYNSANTQFSNFRLDFTFAKTFKVTYTGFLNNPKDVDAYSVVEGTTYSHNIGNHEIIKVKIGGTTINNYTIDSKNNITIPNVTGNVEIIQEIPVDIKVTDPTDALITYSINGGTNQTSRGTLNISVPTGATLKITITGTSLTCGYYEYTETFTNITSIVNEEYKLKKYYEVTITTNPSDATLTYSINGGENKTSNNGLSGRYDPGTIITATASKTGYTPSQTETYTINAHTNYTIALTPITYSYTVTSNVNSNIVLTPQGGGTAEECLGKTSCTIYNIKSGTRVDYSVSADYYTAQSGYKDITSNSSTSITLNQKASQTLTFSGADSADIEANMVESGALHGVDSIIYVDRTLEEDRRIQYNYTEFSGVPNDAKITYVSGRYSVEMRRNTTTFVTTLFIGSTSCWSESFFAEKNTRVTRTVSGCVPPAGTTGASLKSGGVHLHVLARKVSWLYPARWYGSEITVTYIPK